MQTRILTVTTETIPGYHITAVQGVAQGSTVRTKHIGRDIGASLKSIAGGELTGYTEMMSEARAEAIDRLGVEAMQMGANAVVNLRFATADVVGAGAEILAYGGPRAVQPV